ISILLEDDDWGVRADAVRLVHHWQEMSIEPEVVESDEGEEEAGVEIDYEEIAELIQPLLVQLEAMRETETDPYVLFVLNDEV
ncbi:hypothetical protein KAU08_02905, partial [bacterium]|nr:hypothetical protein [bacterium]